MSGFSTSSYFTMGPKRHTVQQEILTKGKFDKFDKFLVMSIFNSSNFN